jgi:hypothetical protein
MRGISVATTSDAIVIKHTSTAICLLIPVSSFFIKPN